MWSVAVVAVGCLAGHLDTAFYILAAVGLAINWFGDSLDGSLARFRKIERPRYGFFVDQFPTRRRASILFGARTSSLMRFDMALLALLGSLAIMFYGHLKLQFYRTWQVSHHGIGPTERGS